MSFEERLNEMLDRVLSEKANFNYDWGEKRRQVVEPLLTKAEFHLRKRLAGARVEPKNGRITLYAKYLANENYLRFAGNDERLEVGYWLETYAKDTTPEPATSEPIYLSLAEITEEKVEEIILDFAAMVARGGRRIRPA